MRAREVRRRPWSLEEDDKLIQAYNLVKSNNPHPPWQDIAEVLNRIFGVEGRSARQCRDRWATRHTEPPPQWTEWEDKILLLAHARFGERWTLIQQIFGQELNGRNAQDIKNRFTHSIRGRIVELPDGIELRTWTRGRPKRKAVIEELPERLPAVPEPENANSAEPLVQRLMRPNF
jgi:hypothetical protein